ncbi:hypothetical protein FP568_15705 [Pandoraea pnomenusa]|uniref:hypothetical protein n=1 Tax=Pandoraea pnomenusa TaxID=93220 RepID=UPI0011983A45|nr:hypothetical protein [Pandoraea pnomenusa]QDX22556.1 hypothetical protein FP568_15705 [Pandoraea pnomenusa]
MKASEVFADMLERLTSLNPCNAKAERVPAVRKRISEKPKCIWDQGTKQWFCFGEYVGHGHTVKDAYLNYLEDAVRVLSRQKKYWCDFAEASSRAKKIRS